MADRIAVLQDGRIAEQGRHADLVAAGGIYARMWEEQAQWYR
jgi:ATP-binding cassette subfamily B protein